MASRSAGIGLLPKLGAVAGALTLGLAVTLTGAEASGDPYGDDYASSGAVSGTLSDVTGEDDDLTVQIGDGGSVTVSYLDNAAYDGAGTDLIIHALDDGSPSTATVEVSADGVTFLSAGAFSDELDEIEIDLGPLGLAYGTSVRVTYLSGDSAGFDLDAIEAVNQIDLIDASLSLDPLSAENPGFTNHTVTATVTDTVTAAGILVSFEVVSGPNAGSSGVVQTDADGEAQLLWTGEGGPGIDVLVAWLDIDGSADVSDDEPSAVATKEWHGVTGTIDLIDLDGGGLVVGDHVQVIVNDRDLDVTDGPDSIDVVVTSTSDPTGITVTLTEDGPQTGNFRGLLELGTTSDEGAAILAATDGDAIEASYDDVLDGQGDDPEPVTAALDVVAVEEAGAKVTVCHRPGGNPGNQKTLTIGSSALEAHLAHGDLAGECGETDILTKQEEAHERKAEHDEARADERAERDERREQERAERDAEFCERKDGNHPRCRD